MKVINGRYQEDWIRSRLRTDVPTKVQFENVRRAGGGTVACADTESGKNIASGVYPWNALRVIPEISGITS
jgi:hypothetical protein